MEKIINKIKMKKIIFIALGIFFISLVSATNISVLYGKNASSGELVPLEINDDGSLKTTLDLTESTGLTPALDNAYDIGTAVLRWATGYFFNFYIDNNLTVVGNVTADYYFGNGSQLTGIVISETDPYWTPNYSDFLTIAAWNDSGLIRNWNVSGHIKDWNASGLIFNASIPSFAYAVSVNSTMKTYVDAQDTTYNNSLKSYTDALDTATNTTMKTYVDSQDTTYNDSMKAYVDLLNTSGLIRDWNDTGLIIDWNDSEYIISWNASGLLANHSIPSFAYAVSVNTTMKTYVDAQDVVYNTTMSNYVGTVNTTMKTYVDALNTSGWIIDWNDTGYIIDWNDTGYIIDWNDTGYIIDWNDTGYIIDWNDTGFIADWNSSGLIFNASIPSFAYAISVNSTMKTYVDNVSEESLWNANFTNVAFTNINETFDENLAVTKNLTVDSTTLFVDSNTDKVGIGTTTPQNLLNVDGDANITGLIYGNGSQLTDVGASPGGTEGAIQFYDAGDLGGNVSQFFINKTSGRIGIGTATLGNDTVRILRTSGNMGLRILGDTGIQADMVFDSPTGGVDQKKVQLLSNAGLFTIRGINDTESALTYNLFVANLTNGNVGINTVTPQNTLNVVGDINATGTIWWNAFNISALNSTGLIQDWNSTGFIANWNASGLIANHSIPSFAYTVNVNTTMKTYVDALDHTDNQNLWLTMTGDAGSIAANTVTDSFAITGGGTVSTAISGDGVIITGSAHDGTGTDDQTFAEIGAGTSTAAFLMGTGGSLGTSGSGTIAATSVPWSGVSGEPDFEEEAHCTEMDGTHLDCSGEELYVSTDFEEESHCAEHDGTDLACSGETLYVSTDFEEEAHASEHVGDGLLQSGETLVFDCSDVASTHLGCSGENLYVSTDFEEESHCTEHDGTHLDCSGEELYVSTDFEEETHASEHLGDGLATSGETLYFDCSDVASTGLACSGEDIYVTLLKDLVSGTGMSGGANDVLVGTDTDLTLNVGGGTCITADTDDMDVTSNCIGNTQLEFDTGQHLKTSSAVQFARLGVNAANTQSGIKMDSWGGWGQTYSAASQVIGSNIYVNPGDTVSRQVRSVNTHGSYGHAYMEFYGGDIVFNAQTAASTADAIVTPVEVMRVDGGNDRLDLNSNNIVNVNKITVGTVDPVYTINGEKYATYMAGMVGLREEVTGTIMLNSSYTIDFKNLEVGSDLWLFYQITDFGENWKNLQVMLTPGFDGKVWYEKNPLENILTIHGESSGEVSYRMTANRFDWSKWSNLYLEDDNQTGFIVPMK